MTLHLIQQGEQIGRLIVHHQIHIGMIFERFVEFHHLCTLSEQHILRLCVFFVVVVVVVVVVWLVVVVVCLHLLGMSFSETKECESFSR
jgi:hypothetical protein